MSFSLCMDHVGGFSSLLKLKQLKYVLSDLNELVGKISIVGTDISGHVQTATA